MRYSLLSIDVLRDETTAVIIFYLHAVKSTRTSKTLKPSCLMKIYSQQRVGFEGSEAATNLYDHREGLRPRFILPCSLFINFLI